MVEIVRLTVHITEDRKLDSLNISNRKFQNVLLFCV